MPLTLAGGLIVLAASDLFAAMVPRPAGITVTSAADLTRSRRSGPPRNSSDRGTLPSAGIGRSSEYDSGA